MIMLQFLNKGCAIKGMFFFSNIRFWNASELNLVAGFQPFFLIAGSSQLGCYNRSCGTRGPGGNDPKLWAGSMPATEGATSSQDFLYRVLF